MSPQDKERIKQFIKDNDLDFNIVDESVSKYHIIAYDGIKFHFENHNNNWVLVKYDPKKDDIFNVGSQAFEYLQFKTLTQILEQLLYHDNSISKTYWNLINDSMEIGVSNYSDGWYNNIIKDNNWLVEDMDTYKIITYTNNNYNPELKSPLNTIHEISPINELTYTKCDKLYFEIHPVNLLEGSETYLVKLLCNNDEIFKEYINYIIFKKKGLKMFLEVMFNDMVRFKVK
jgi:hypothetical protein